MVDTRDFVVVGATVSTVQGKQFEVKIWRATNKSFQQLNQLHNAWPRCVGCVTALSRPPGLSYLALPALLSPCPGRLATPLSLYPSPCPSVFSRGYEWTRFKFDILGFYHDIYPFVFAHVTRESGTFQTFCGLHAVPKQLRVAL